jgi:transcriptional regulator with XRE-family HTH domain
MPGKPITAAKELGWTLRRQRLANGWSLRLIARRMGLSSHSSLIDYEHGRRIPPQDLLQAFERALEFPSGQLQTLRKAALKERADVLCQKPKQHLPIFGIIRHIGRVAATIRRSLP